MFKKQIELSAELEGVFFILSNLNENTHYIDGCNIKL